MKCLCRIRGHALPKRISAASHPEIITITADYGSGGQVGIARPIQCPRCKVMISPMSPGYPIVEPSAFRAAA